MKTARWTWICVAATWVAAAGCGTGEARRPEATAVRAPQLRPFDNGAFTMQVPEGWQMELGGDCSSLAFVLRDPREPLRMIFFFGMVGPVYQAQMQKQIDYQYMAGQGFPVEWFDMPVVDPLTPENLLANFAQIASSQIAQRFIRGCPRLERFQAVATEALRPPLPAPGARSSLVRGVFAENGRAAQGLFTATTAPFMPMMGGPGGGTAYGYLLAGITAPKEEFEALRPTLLKSLASYTVNERYVGECMVRSEAAFREVMRAGQTLRETSDMIARSWEARQRTDDVMAEKRSDAILGKERLYDPGTGEVYEFENGFHDRYRLNPGAYRNANLEPLPAGDHGLWTAPTRDGRRELGL